MLGVAGKSFENWARTFKCSPELYFEPTSIDEIRQVIQQAASRGKKLRVIGCAHSPSSLPFTTDYMVSLRRMNKLVDIDKERLIVKVEPGMLISDLNRILNDNGMALSVQGSISDQTIGGAVAVSNHGTGLKYGTLSSYVLELDIMDSSGRVSKLRKSDNLNDEFYASVVSLGCLGVVLSLTIQCEPAFNLEEIQYPAKLEDVLRSLDVHLNASDHFRMFWYPHTDNAVCYHISRTTNKVDSRPSLLQRAWNWVRDKACGYYMLEYVLWLSTLMPSLVPLINKWHYKLFCSWKKQRIDTSYKVFNFDCLFKQYVYEGAIPIKETAYYLTKLKSWLENNPRVKAHFAVEIRFVKSDELWLSPCYQTDSCYINILMFKPYGKEFDRKAYWDFNERLMVECGGRPHWAKTFSLTREYFERVYPRFNDFEEIRRQRDPNNMFINDFLKPIFLK